MQMTNVLLDIVEILQIKINSFLVDCYFRYTLAKFIVLLITYLFSLKTHLVHNEINEVFRSVYK